MNRTTSIVPRGFDISAHPVFLSYQIPEIRSVCIETREMLIEKYNDDIVKNEAEENETQQHCPICLRRFEDPVTMVECQHSFCMECINIWFQTVRKCPICNNESDEYVQCSDSKEEETSSSHTLITRTWKLWSTSSTSSTSIVSLDKETAILAMKEHTLLLQNQKKQIEAEAESAIQMEKKRKVTSPVAHTETQLENKKKKKQRHQNP